MSDARQVLTTALGMPLAWITTKNNEQILVSNTYGTIKSINQFITKFVYRYDDEEGDECTIELALPKIEDFDNKAFVADNILNVEWGYMMPNGTLLKSKKRIVVIRDIHPSYTDEKMCIELVCTSMFAYTKRITSNHTADTNTVFEFYKEAAAGKFIPTISVDGPLKLLHIDDKANMSYIHHGSGSKSLYAMMQKAAGVLPNGPYHIEGQDDKAIIHKRNWNAKPTAIFSYAGGNGELISFKAKSNVEKTNADNVDQDFIDPETKKMTKSNYTTAIQHGNNPSDVPEDVAKVMLDNYASLTKWNIEHPLDQKPMPTEETIKTTVENNSMDWLGTNAKKPFYMKPFINRTEYITSYNRYTYKSVLQSPYADAVQRQNLIENYTKKKLERKFEADAEMVGDPSLENRRVYTFKGLSKQDSGDWYCNTAEHMITMDGYRVTLGLLRKPILLSTTYESNGKTFQEEWANVKPPEVKTEDFRQEQEDKARAAARAKAEESSGPVGRFLGSFGSTTWDPQASIDNMKTRIKQQTIEEEIYLKQLAEDPEYSQELSFLPRPNGTQTINSAEA